MAEYIIKQDSLNTGRKKINEVLTISNDNSSKAKSDSAEALLKAIESMNLSDRTRKELAQAILEGDSSPLGGQLSVGADGTVYGDPQERLIAENERLKSQLAHIAINVKSFGAKGDGLADDRMAVQNAVDYAEANDLSKVTLPKGKLYFSGSVVIPSDISIEGAGLDITIINMKDSANPAFVIKQPTIKTLAQSNDIKAGDTFHLIDNDLIAGDHLVFSSNNRFTEEWDLGTAIRSYYNKGEIFKVKSADSTSVTFSEPSSMSLPASTVKHVETFTPTKNISFSNFSVVRNRKTTGESKAISIKYAEKVTLSNIGTENTNHAGILVDRSRDVTINNFHGKGGTADLGLNYGIAIVDGSKNVNINGVYASGFRHAITGGGTGYAIPMNVFADSITVSDSQLHSLDTHGNTKNFMFTNCVVDNGFSVSGIGHIVDNLKSQLGLLQLYEGGTDITCKNIIFFKGKGFYADRVVHRALFENITLNLNSIYTNSATKGGSTFVIFKNVKVINKDFDNAVDIPTADATLPSDGASHYGFYLRDNFTLLNCYTEGFVTALYVNGKDCYVDDVTAVNCGWTSSLSSYPCVLQVSKNADKSYINNFKTGYNKTGVSNNATRTIRLDNLGTGTGKQVTISNVKHTKEHTMTPYYGIFADAVFTELFLQNVRLAFGSGGNSVSATGKFIYNTVVDDN
ncbi:hypothetical protein J2Z23_004164 [Lederbergia galactosidilyticus]|uniref:glycosyl hydrolase family 28-related protein n=1 Tax=Lederbergia galactosidilytica TaxID=217031 RepID=UPI001AE1D17D|nr:glycosyl hydrolase family 28-related protein [Lederbergia galactosidilytica]MBP1917179.1 hypothetical protein [Lederbergia galactosidilytica]